MTMPKAFIFYHSKVQPELTIICLALGGIFTVGSLAWKMKRPHPIMKSSFRHDPLSGKSYTLFTSMFR